MTLVTASLLAMLGLLLVPSPATADFGIRTFTVDLSSHDDTIDERAASHPLALQIHLAMKIDHAGEPEGSLREIRADLPPGLAGNPLATPRCSLTEFDGAVPRCPGATQVGVLRGIVSDIGEISTPLYNLKPLPGSAASFGVSVNGEHYLQRLSLTGTGAESRVGFEMTLPSEPAIIDIEEEIWGIPANGAHDRERVCRDGDGQVVEGCSSDAAERPLLTLPASCAAPLRTSLTVISADQPPVIVTASALSTDAGGNARPLAGCESVPFDPRLAVRLGASASAPTPLAVELAMPEDEGSEQANARLATLRLELPSGLVLNPAAGSWLTPTSRIGSVDLQTPLVDHALVGSIRLAAPVESPFASRVDVELAIEDEATGTNMTIPAEIEADPDSGRLTATIDDLPQIPIEDLDLEFAGGPRAVLAAPSDCGEYAAAATLTPSTAPFAPSRSRRVSMAIATGPGGGPCPPPETERPAAPTFEAGTLSSAAGSDAPLVLRLARGETDQRFGSFDLTLPPGLAADLGSLPLGSRVGGVQVRAGVGPEPLALQGDAYLGGPYRGAPYSLALVVPTRVGPFDLGTITERVAVDVDPVTAQISIRADPLPQILGGVPLALRELRVDIDRAGFVRNPTSCEPAAITGSATSAIGRSAQLSARFSVANCRGLPFKPKLFLGLSGALGRGGHPAVRAVYRGDPDGAAPERVAFGLPAGELLDLRHLGKLCPRGVAAELCPRSSHLGSLRIETPMLGAPLEGDVYLRVPSGRLPDLSAEVRGGGLRFLLHGRTTDRGGRLGVSLDSLPDVPLSRAVLSLAGGRHGIVVNSESLCSGRRHAVAHFGAHSGKQRRLRVPVRLDTGC